MEHKRLKVLLGCYACAPDSGSEPGMGWNFVRNIARFHDVHVIVEETKFKPQIELYLNKHPEEGRNITFHYIPRKRNRLLRKIWPPSYYWFYRGWQKRAYRLASALHEKEHFDLIHQITLAGFREPGYLWKLPIPFIWGPIGGFTQTPWSLIPGCGLHGMLYFGFRNIINILQKYAGYAGRQVARKAHTIFVSDNQGLSDISRYWHRSAESLLEVSSNTIIPDESIARRDESDKLQICWAGHLIPLKALELLLHALSECKNGNITLEVLGGGKMAAKWQRLARLLKVDHMVHFRGRLKHEEVQQIMRSSHVFCHTSIKEGGTGTVILEALQNGLPAIILNHGGAALLIDETCGIKIPICNRKQISADIAKHLDHLADNEALRQNLAKGALARSRQFTWDSKMDTINRIYAQALTESLFPYGRQSKTDST